MVTTIEASLLWNTAMSTVVAVVVAVIGNKGIYSSQVPTRSKKFPIQPNRSGNERTSNMLAMTDAITGSWLGTKMQEDVQMNGDERHLTKYFY
jgi:hypothetical protein